MRNVRFTEYSFNHGQLEANIFENFHILCEERVLLTVQSSNANVLS